MDSDRPPGTEGSSHRSAQSIDVIVPVYGAPEELRRCLHSVIAHTDLARHRLLVVFDGPQDDQVEAVWEHLPVPTGKNVEIDRRPIRSGFVASVNHGIARSKRDVVLLNSDAVVTSGWLEKLSATAVSRSDVASVTPWSNNATLCSIPFFLADNLLPTGYGVDEFGALVTKLSLRRRPEIPTGVGVCLFMRRSVIEEIGPFDEQAFGFGYGEESDWCARASARGYVHLLEDSTFVFHLGQGSFGSSRAARVKKAHRVMRRRHPSYLPQIAEFMRRDPLAPLRAPLVAHLRPAADPEVAPGLSLLVVERNHALRANETADETGGTGSGTLDVVGSRIGQIQELSRSRGWSVSMHRVIAHRNRTPGDCLEQIHAGVRIRSTVVERGRAQPPFANRHAIELLDQEAVDLVHLRGFSSVSSRWLMAAIERRGIPWIFEWLVDDPLDPFRPTDCDRPSRFGLWLLERRLRRILVAADAFLFPTDSVRQRVVERFTGIEEGLSVVASESAAPASLESLYQRVLDRRSKGP